MTVRGRRSRVVVVSLVSLVSVVGIPSAYAAGQASLTGTGTPVTGAAPASGTGLAIQDEFAAGPTEVGDLLQFVHDPGAAIGGSLLDGDTLILSFEVADHPWPPGTELPIVTAIGSERPRPLVIVDTASHVVGRIRPAEHRHLSVLADAGFQLHADLAVGVGAMSSASVFAPNLTNCCRHGSRQHAGATTKPIRLQQPLLLQSC